MLNIVVEKLLKCREMLNTVKCIIFWLWKGGGGGGEWNGALRKPNYKEALLVLK